MIFMGSPSACWRRASSSDGEIGIAVIGKPSASSMAAANTAADGITPASPAPLMPSGLSGDGVSRWSMSIVVGDLGDVGHQEVHERRVQQLAGLVVGHPLVERAADALRDAAVDLALDDHRVDQVGRSRGPRRTCRILISAVSGSVSTITACMPEAKVARSRRVEVAALQARLVVLGDRRLARVADRELGGGLGRLVEGVAQRVGQHGHGAEGDRGVRARP